MAGGTSAPEPAPRSSRAPQHFGTIVVVGGGCYGGYYVRQLGRAHDAGALTWNRLLVVDRDPRCAVASLDSSARPPALQVVTSEWEPFFRDFLAEAATSPDAGGDDAIVPSPLMPHLMADWLAGRARERWPAREVSVVPLGTTPAVPWQRAGDDGTHYVSFAEWMCPINCIEPDRCPHTRGERSWSMPVAVREWARAEALAGRPMQEPLVFRCLHRAYGVGMLDVRDIVAADAAIAGAGARGTTRVVVGTVSHCHGALRQLLIGE